MTIYFSFINLFTPIYLNSPDFSILLEIPVIIKLFPIILFVIIFSSYLVPHIQFNILILLTLLFTLRFSLKQYSIYLFLKAILIGLFILKSKDFKKGVNSFGI